MNDDFAGDPSTSGRYQLSGAPIIVRSEFENDADWFEVSSLRKFYDYTVTVFLPPEQLESITGFVTVGFYDEEGRTIRENRQRFRTIFQYTHTQSSGNRFVGITAESEGAYRFQAFESDITGDTRELARYFQPNFGPYHAGSITTTDDVDMFRVRLIAGVDYQFDLLGVASESAQGSTLPDPHLRLFDADSLITSDNNSGGGTNARIAFTPELTGDYFLSVSGNGTLGSYLLGFPNVDDFAGSPATEGRLRINQRTEGRGDWRGDTDWFRFKVDEGFRYYFGNTRGAQEVRLYDLQGQPIQHPETDYFADKEQTIFVSVEGRDDYEITPNYREEYSGSTFSSATFFPPGTIVGAIETDEDFDLLRIDPAQFAFYEFNLETYGNRPLQNAQLITYDTNGNLLQRYDAGESVTVRTFGNDSDVRYVLVHSVEEGTGAWRLSQTQVDRAAGDTSTRWQMQFNNGIGYIRNSLDSFEDVDFHRIKMQANAWYEIDSRNSTARLSIQRPNGTEVPITEMVNNFDRSYFYSPVAADHYLVARQSAGTTDNEFQRIAVSIRQNAAFKTLHDSTIPQWLDDQFLRTRFQGLPVEVFSELPLEVDGEMIAPRTLTNLEFDQWKTFALPASLDRSGDIYVRGIYGNGLMQDWSKIAVSNPNSTEEIANPDAFRFLQYAFMDELPEEYTGDPQFEGFETLSLDERQTFRSAARKWSNVRGVTIREDNNMITRMQVFKVDLGEDQPLLAFPPNDEGRGFDVILNSNSSIFQSPENDEGIFNLLQAIGTGMGLQPSDNVDRRVSVMGNRIEPGFENVFPTTPLNADVLAFDSESPFPASTTEPVTQNNYVLLNGSEPLLRSVSSNRNDGSFRWSISATGLAEPVTIDLRGGQQSFVRGGATRIIENDPYALLADALGGLNDDRLFGSETDNNIRGFSGNDLIRGDSGNDRLSGGLGDDFYIFRPASHQDIISEAAPVPGGGFFPAGGTDVIRIEGMYDYDSIAEDLTFSRLGNDLVIRLELNGQRNVNGDSIRITDMDDESKRVEALTLLTPGGFVDRISLASVFEQADSQRRRFEVLPSNDEFGSLVQRI